MSGADAVELTPLREEGGTPESAGGASRSSRDPEAMVARCLDPAIGLCMRVFDPLRRNPEQSQLMCRELVVTAVRQAALHRCDDSDEAVHLVMRRLAEVAHDSLLGTSLVAPWPAQVPADEVLPEGVGLDEVAPSGRLGLADLQDATAALRRADRQVAFVVMAAGLSPERAAVLLGRDEVSVKRSLRRVGTHLADGAMITSVRSPVAP